MGSSSSVLDENKVNFIKGLVQTELSNFASIYKKQYSLAFLAHVHDELVQRKQEHSRLLIQRDPPQEDEVIYQESVFSFNDGRKWKERFVVVRANYCLECHESPETFLKGTVPLYKLPTTGGTVLTTEEKYLEVIDMCFSDTDNVKEDFAPPVVGMPGQFPVYLRLPYQRDYYFCFLKEAKQAQFVSVLSDCIRHQNQDFLKQKTYEVQAFVRAVQFYRQDKGDYEPWDMLIGNDVQVLSNLIMEELLPCLEQDLLPRVKTKKRTWIATIEAAYNLVHETLVEGMAALKDECRETTTQQNALILSHMDQIMSSQAFLETQLRATVAELATEFCRQHIEPRLSAVLEEIMGPISLGYAEARQVSESMMENLWQNYQEGMTIEAVQQALEDMSKPNLESCYEKLRGLKDHIQEFNYPNCRGLEQSTQIDIQQLVDSVAYTYGLLLNKSSQDNSNLLDAMIKAKQRVLKQYDHDSSTERKKIFHDALLSITLPSVKAFLAPTYKKELPDFEKYIFNDFVNFINVENVYEDILQQILEEDISKVVKEAASMKKYNLFLESRYRFSTLATPPDSLEDNSPANKANNALQSSPLLSHVLMANQCAGEDPVISENMVEQEVFLDQQDQNIQPKLTEIHNGEDGADKMVEPEVLVVQQVEVQAHSQPNVEQKVEDNKEIEISANETRVRSSTPETPRVHAAVVEEMQVSTQSLEVKMYSPNEAATNTEAIMDLSRSSYTEPALQPAAPIITAHIPKPVETETNETSDQASPPEGDTRSVDQVSSLSVSTESGANIRIGPSEDATPDVPVFSDVQQNIIASGDTKATLDELTSHDAPVCEVGCRKVTDVSDDSSWTTEEEGSIEDEDEYLASKSTTAILKPDESSRVKCEALDIVANNAGYSKSESDRPLDCIREIRDLVVEVIEVEEMPQHYPDNTEVNVNNTQ